MKDFLQTPSTAFEGDQRLAHGALADTALAVRAAHEMRPDSLFLTFDDSTGKVIDLDLRGSDEDVLRRLRARAEVSVNEPTARTGIRGRPKLGVVAREITLLPRQWDWLAGQPGGASQTLRRLVDQASSAGPGKARTRAAWDACYSFMSAMAGNFAGFEEASRALFADDLARLARLADGWPPDIRDHTLRLAGAAR